MTRLIIPTLLLTLAGLAAARQCQNLTIPISITSRNAVFSQPAPSSDMDVTNFVLDYLQAGHNYTDEVLEGYAAVSGDYHIAATYCEPDHATAKTRTVQVLTHGVGFDRSYWDFPANNYNYSYVNTALDRGYATFAWDRLGTGQSSRGDPVNEIQSYLELSALHALTTMLRAGSVPDVAACFDKVVHVGHSFGSILTYGLTALYPPGTSDGIALTGFSADTASVPYFVFGSNFVLARGVPAFADYADGYIANGDAAGFQVTFFAPGDFDPDIWAAGYAAGQPATVGEFLSIGGPVSGPNAFEGPVIIVTGERDLPFCGGNCSSTVPSILEAAKPAFTNTSHFEAFAVPGTGHGLNLEYTWPLSYKTIGDFFDKQV